MEIFMCGTNFLHFDIKGLVTSLNKNTFLLVKAYEPLLKPLTQLRTPYSHEKIK